MIRALKPTPSRPTFSKRSMPSWLLRSMSTASNRPSAKPGRPAFPSSPSTPPSEGATPPPPAAHTTKNPTSDAIVDGDNAAQVGVDNYKVGVDIGKHTANYIRKTLGGKAQVGVVGALN